MNHRQRIENCLNQANIDRIPVALWRHFPVDDQNPETLASAIINFQRTFDFDIVKVTPSSSYCLTDWGVKDEWHGASEGTRDYSHHVISHPEDWTHLPILDPTNGMLSEQITCLQILNREFGGNTPVIQTIFNPLSQAKNLIGRENLTIHIRRYPEALHEGLRVITETTRRFISEIEKIGISGIFFAVQHAQYGALTVDEYKMFGTKYDLQVLESAQNMWIKMLHLHGTEIMFDLFLDYPVNIVNWHDQDTSPSLSAGKSRFRGVVCGGLSREESLVFGTPEQITLEATSAVNATSGKRFILGTGCVVPIIAPYGNIMAARRCVESISI